MKSPCTVEEGLQVVGSYGRYQKLLNIIFCFINIPVAMQILIITFCIETPTWKCSQNSTQCTAIMQGSGPFPAANRTRCKLPKGSWTYTPLDPHYSIVTQFGVDCENEWILELLSSVLFVGWGIGAILLGIVGDKCGRKALMYPTFAALIGCGFLSSFLSNVYLLVGCRFLVGFFIHGTTTQAYILISEIVGSKQRPYACLALFGFSTIAWCLLDLQAYLLQNWKLLNIMSTVPYLLILLFYKITPESIQWLQSKGRQDEVVDILRKIGKWNNKPLPDDFTLVVTEQNTTTKQKKGVIDLFRDGRLAKQSLQQFYMWLVIAMGYYGLVMAASDLGGDFYANFIYLNLADVPGLFATMYLTDRVGRKWPTLCSLLIGGTFCIGVGITPAHAHTMRVILGNLGKFCLCVAFDGVYTWTVELYPRGTFFRCSQRRCGLFSASERDKRFSRGFFFRKMIG